MHKQISVLAQTLGGQAAAQSKLWPGSTRRTRRTTTLSRCWCRVSVVGCRLSVCLHLYRCIGVSVSISESGFLYPNPRLGSGLGLCFFLVGRQLAVMWQAAINQTAKRQTAIGFKCKLISMSIYNNNLLAFCISTARDFISQGANAMAHGNIFKTSE